MQDGFAGVLTNGTNKDSERWYKQVVCSGGEQRSKGAPAIL